LSQSSEESDGGEKQITEDKMLGVDKNTSLDVILKKGPYGFYIQLGDNNTDKPKRVAIPKGVDIQSVNIEYASGLLSLPRQVGKHPETGKVVTAGIGRFGPYLRYDSKYTSLKDDDVLTIGINRAVSLIAENQAKNSNDPLKTLGKYPGTEKEIGVYSGRYGPYVKYEKINASLPKNLEVETITLEQAVELIDNKSKKPKKSKTKKQIII
jgi:DNA topoisomerase-1